MIYWKGYVNGIFPLHLLLHYSLFLSSFILSFLHLLTCFYVCATSPPTPNPQLPGRTCSALFSDFVEEKTQEIIKKNT
jgi:hypothetical protein